MNSIRFFTFAFFISTNGFAIYTTCKKNAKNQLVITVDNIKKDKNHVIRFKVEKTKKVKSVPVLKQRKVTFTTPKNFFNPKKRQRVLVSIKDYYKHSDYKDSCYYYPNSIAKQVKPEKKNQPEKQLDGQKIKKYANQQARTVANRVVKSYGARENFNFNFTKGLHDGYLAKKIFDISNSQYKAGFEEGAQQSKSKAEYIAHQVATNQAVEKGKRDALARHKEAIQTGSVDDTVITPSATFIPPARVENNFNLKREDIFSETKNKIAFEFSKYKFGDATYSINYNTSFLNIDKFLHWEGKYHFVDSFFADDHAYDEWKTKGYGSGYDYALYNKMDWSEKSTFEHEFKSVYRSVIKEKLQKTIQQPNQEAYMRGVYWGSTIADQESKEKGFADGYSNGLENFGKRAFERFFPIVYEQQFIHYIDFYDVNPYLAINLKLEFADENDAALNLEGSLSNLGGVPSSPVSISVISNMFMQLDHQKLEPIEAHSEREVQISKYVTLRKPILADTSYLINLEVNKFQSQVKFNLSFEEIIEKFTKCKIPKTKELLKQSILATIKQEWDDNHGIFDEDIYKHSLKKELKRSYLGQLINYVRSREAKQVRALKDEIIDIHRSGSWLHFNKNSSFKTLLDKLS